MIEQSQNNKNWKNKEAARSAWSEATSVTKEEFITTVAPAPGNEMESRGKEDGGKKKTKKNNTIFHQTKHTQLKVKPPYGEAARAGCTGAGARRQI